MQTPVNEQRLDAVALAWLWCQRDKPATEAKLATAIKAMVPEGSAKDLASTAMDRLINTGRAEQITTGKRKAAASIRITAAGGTSVCRWIGRTQLPAGASPFGSICTYELPAIASGLPLPQADKKSQKAFTGLLPLMVCARHYNLPVSLESGPVAAKLELVKVALSRTSHVAAERIYLKKLPGGALPALVVGPLLGEPGTAIGNLDKLIVAAACKILTPCKPAQIKLGIIRRWLVDEPAALIPSPGTPAFGSEAQARRGEGQGGGLAGSGRSDSMRYLETSPPPPQPSPGVPGEGGKPSLRAATQASPIDLPTFSRQALAAAKAVAREGGPGVSSLGDKVLVHYVWRQYEKTFGPLPLERFKQNLSDVNGDHLVLAREDLILGDRAEEFSQSEVRTGGSRYHYIRVGNLIEK